MGLQNREDTLWLLAVPCRCSTKPVLYRHEFCKWEVRNLIAKRLTGCFLGILLVLTGVSTHGADTAEEVLRLPAFTITTLAGFSVTEAGFSHGLFALAFVSSDCRASAVFLGLFRQAAELLPEVTMILVAVEDHSLALDDLLAGHEQIGPVLLDPERGLMRTLALEEIPSFVLLTDGYVVQRVSGRLTSELLLPDVGRLAAGGFRDLLPPADVVVGQAAPEFSAGLLSGEVVTLSDLTSPLLLFFLTPHKLPEEGAVARTLTEIAGEHPELPIYLIVSPWGEEAALQDDMTISLPLILDDKGLIARAYGVRRRPLAMLIDSTLSIGWIGLFGPQFADELAAALNEPAGQAAP